MMTASVIGTHWMRVLNQKRKQDVSCVTFGEWTRAEKGAADEQ
jgi:hypothetical protein